jgi:hypothetical protein
MVIIKFNIFNMNPVLLLVIIIVLIFLSIIFNIQDNIKKGKEQKLAEEEAQKESQWTNEVGRNFYELLLQRVRNNESAPITSFTELQGLTSFTKETINQHFGITDPQYEFRIPVLLEFLNSRYLAETDELVGIPEEQAQTEHGINLTNDECLYEMYEECSWFELKRNQERSWNYHGLGLRIPLGGGLSYRIGSIQNLNPEARYEYRKISTGKVYLTNKRIIFQGESENKVVTLKSLLDIEQYNDSCVIGKSTGKKPIIKFQFDDAAIFARKLSRLFDTV